MKKTILILVVAILLSLSAPVSAQLLYYPVEPCRIVDTRVETIITCHPDNFGICSHYFASGGLYAFLVAGDETRVAYKDRGWPSVFQFTFVDQGGKAGGCGIPREAKAVNLAVTVNPKYPFAGHIRLWRFEISGYHPWGDIPIPRQPPIVSLNFPWNHPNSWHTNSLTIDICDPQTAPFGDCNEDVLIKVYGNPVLLIVDVYGYFLDQ